MMHSAPSMRTPAVLFFFPHRRKSQSTHHLRFRNFLQAASLLKPRQLQDAPLVFDKMPLTDPTKWDMSQLRNALKISIQSSPFDSTIRIFNMMRSNGFKTDLFAYVGVISACMAQENPNFGEQFLSLVLKVGILSNDYVLSGLMDLFAKCGKFDDALGLFLDSCSYNVVCWNTIIAGAVRNGENFAALKLFQHMVDGFCLPTGFTFSSVLSACAASGEIEAGRGVHAWVVKFNEQDDIFVGTGMVNLYAKFGDMDAAVEIFSLMPIRNVVSWTAIISGFVQNDDGLSALKYFKQMMRSAVDVNKYTITSVLFACATRFMEESSFQVHGWILKSGLYADPVVKEALISTYGRNGNLQMAEKVFRRGPEVHLSDFSAMISALVQSSSLESSIELFRRMQAEELMPDNRCISSILSIVDSVKSGEQLHSYTVKTGLVDDVLVCSSLFTMYSKCGNIEDSYHLFRQISHKDRVAWTSMISGFACHGNAQEAFRLFRDMILEGIEPDDSSLSSALTACCGETLIGKVKEIHGFALRHGLTSGPLFGSTLISVYSKCSYVESARRMFDQIPCKDQIIWSSLISGYSSNNRYEEAIWTFCEMVTTVMQIDHITMSSVLGSCAQLTRAELGSQLHGKAIKNDLVRHDSVASALVTLYSRCGAISESRKLFDRLQTPDLVTWTAMLEGYAQHGRSKEALDMFELMKRKGVKPDSVTFVSVLSACSHNGLVDEGFLHFRSMKSEHGVEPDMHHYACMVDLLGRAGRLKEAVYLIDRMPTEAGPLVWSTLLAACRLYGDVELGNWASKRVLDLEPHDSGAYVAASNMSAEMGDWEQVGQIRNLMKGIGMKKEPGWSAMRRFE